MDLESRYEFLEKIGKGTFATVYRARDNELGREVAIKQIHDQYLDEPEQLSRYWDEAQLLASLQHPNIVTIYDIHRDRGWLIMELMQSNLADRLEGRPMDLRSLKTTVAHCLRALKYLHARGVIHGDLKPSNFMIDSRRRVKIGDFGLARRASDDDGSLLKGTTKYMAPEVVAEEFGEIGPSSDLYSLGFSAYDLMCGENFESLFPGLSAFGRNKQVAWMMWHAAPDRRLPDIKRVLEGVPEDLGTVVQKLCEKDQTKRFKSADEALDALNVDLKVVKEGSIDPDDDEAPASDEAARKKRLMLLGGAFAVSLIMSMVMLFLPSGDTESDEPKLKFGTITEVLLDENKIVIEDDEGYPEEILLGAKPRIELKGFAAAGIEDKKLLLRQLEKGDRIEIDVDKLDDGSRRVTFIVARPVLTHGQIRDIDSSARTIVVTMLDGAREDLPLRVPERAAIILNEKPSRLVKAKSGDKVDILHLPEAGRKAGRLVHKMTIKRLITGMGYVTAVDPVQRTISFSTTMGQNVNARSLPLSDDCSVKIVEVGSAERFMELNDIKVNDRVQVEYFAGAGAEQIVVTRDKQQSAGIVQGVTGTASVQIRENQTGKILQFDTTSAATTIVQEAGAISDVRKGDHVTISYQPAGSGGKASRVDVTRRPVDTDRWAVVIANQDFTSRFLSKLKYANADGQLVRDTLVKRYFFQADRILHLEDHKAKPTQTDIAEYLTHASKPEQVIIYVVSHGYVDPNGDVYIAGSDFDFDNMKGTGIPLAWLIDQMERCVAEDKILILDLCHSGSGKDLLKQPSTQEMVDTIKPRIKTVKVIASCGKGERGLMLKTSSNGVFAYYLAEGLSGKAESSGDDRRITAEEMSGHLTRSLKAVPIPGGHTQTPALTVP